MLHHLKSSEQMNVNTALERVRIYSSCRLLQQFHYAKAAQTQTMCKSIRGKHIIFDFI